MRLNKIRMGKLSIVGEVTNYTSHSLVEVETNVRIGLDSDTMMYYEELNGYKKMMEDITGEIKNMVKSICEKTSIVNYAKFTLNDDEGFPLFTYVVFPHYNEIQYAVMDEGRKEFVWSERAKVTNSGDLKEIIEVSSAEVANGVFNFIEENIFEFE